MTYCNCNTRKTLTGTRCGMKSGAAGDQQKTLEASKRNAALMKSLAVNTSSKTNVDENLAPLLSSIEGGAPGYTGESENIEDWDQSLGNIGDGIAECENIIAARHLNSGISGHRRKARSSGRNKCHCLRPTFRIWLLIYTPAAQPAVTVELTVVNKSFVVKRADRCSPVGMLSTHIACESVVLHSVPRDGHGDFKSTQERNRDEDHCHHKKGQSTLEGRGRNPAGSTHIVANVHAILFLNTFEIEERVNNWGPSRKPAFSSRSCRRLTEHLRCVATSSRLLLLSLFWPETEPETDSTWLPPQKMHKIRWSCRKHEEGAQINLTPCMHTPSRGPTLQQHIRHPRSHGSCLPRVVFC